MCGITQTNFSFVDIEMMISHPVRVGDSPKIKK